ncbi:MAG TPA: aldo/keto reductase [Myxococcaceae bacterium]|nr:aldo/keto reductase [Myxococcaceae bacterium]
MIPRIEIAPGITLSRLIKGGWHLAGDHGDVDPDRAIRDMAAFVDAGITTFDCADIYTGVEELIGRFRREYPGHAARLRVHTKFVPDLDELASVDRAYVERIVDRSLQRLGVERLDLVQFHWWDHSVARHVEVALELERLRKAGKVDRIGVTNFGMAELGELLDAGVPVLTHQLQYSLLDDRPEHGMVELCRERGIALLAYGTVAGGFLSDRWLGQPSPGEPLGNRSLVKYRLIIDEFGGWPLFQELLGALRQVAERHGCDIATVATRAVLDRPGVAAAIVGATSAAHLAAHARVGSLELDRKDQSLIEAVTRRRAGPPGDVYALERDREGPHGRIMKYTLNR